MNFDIAKSLSEFQPSLETFSIHNTLVQRIQDLDQSMQAAESAVQYMFDDEKNRRKRIADFTSSTDILLADTVETPTDKAIHNTETVKNLFNGDTLGDADSPRAIIEGVDRMYEETVGSKPAPQTSPVDNTAEPSDRTDDGLKEARIKIYEIHSRGSVGWDEHLAA